MTWERSAGCYKMIILLAVCILIVLQPNGKIKHSSHKGLGLCDKQDRNSGFKKMFGEGKTQPARQVSPSLFIYKSVSRRAWPPTAEKFPESDQARPRLGICGLRTRVQRHCPVGEPLQIRVSRGQEGGDLLSGPHQKAGGMGQGYATASTHARNKVSIRKWAHPGTENKGSQLTCCKEFVIISATMAGQTHSKLGPGHFASRPPA